MSDRRVYSSLTVRVLVRPTLGPGWDPRDQEQCNNWCSGWADRIKDVLSESRGKSKLSVYFLHCTLSDLPGAEGREKSTSERERKDRNGVDTTDVVDKRL